MDITELQRNILQELLQGSTNSQIAEKVGYSERSINRKLKELCKMFKVTNRNSLIREVSIAKSRGLIKVVALRTK